ADQRAVDVRLGDQFTDVAGLHRPAVEHPHLIGDLLAVLVRQRRAESCAHLLGVGSGGHLAGADGPHRLVRHHDLPHLLGLQPLETGDELSGAVVHVVAGFPDLQLLAHAEDRAQLVLESCPHLAVDELVGLGVVLAALGVPDDDVGAAELGQHRAGDLTGVRPGVVRRDVLGAVLQQQLVPVHQRLHAADVGERGQHRHLDLVEVLLRQREGDLLHQGDRLQVVEVHLPVAGDQRLPGHQPSPSSTATPGSCLPSRNSSEAPPPVEICEKPASGKPGVRTAAAESPPPTTLNASESTMACAIPRVPSANASNSNTPAGPFQNTVRASARMPENSSTLRGPMSSPIQSAGISSTPTVRFCASAANRSATTTSTGSTSLSPCSASSWRVLSSWSSCSRDLPTSWPWAARNV